MAVFDKRRKKCFFHENNITHIDFTDVRLLQRFLSANGKILPRRITGISAVYQRKLAKAVKVARHAGLLAPKQAF